MSPKIKKIIYSLLAIVSAILVYFYQQIQTYQKQQDLFLVTEVLDGDTLIIAPDQSMRLANIDTPSIDNCFGQEAKDFLQKNSRSCLPTRRPTGQSNHGPKWPGHLHQHQNRRKGKNKSSRGICQKQSNWHI